MPYSHHRVAADPVVRLGAEGGDLQPEPVPLRADRAELAPGLPDRLGPALDHPQRLRRAGRRCRSPGRRRAGRAGRPAPNRRPGAARARRGRTGGPARRRPGETRSSSATALRCAVVSSAAFGGVGCGGFGHGIASLSGAGTGYRSAGRGYSRYGLTMVMACGPVPRPTYPWEAGDERRALPQRERRAAVTTGSGRTDGCDLHLRRAAEPAGRVEATAPPQEAVAETQRGGATAR